MNSQIFHVSGGKLVSMMPAAPASEDEVQELVASHPEIIADETALLLVKRE